MATERKWRRGTTAQHASFTGALGEVTLDTDRYGAVVHDGSTAGGKYRWPTSKEIQDNSMVYAAVSGTDTLTWTSTPARTAYVAGAGGLIKIANNNTGSVTGNDSGLGAKTFKKITSAGLANLEADDLVAGGIYPWVYDGTYILIVGGGLGAAGGPWVKLDSQTVSGVSSVDFAGLLNSTYDTYMIVGERIVPSTAQDIYVRAGYGGTPTYVTATYTTVGWSVASNAASGTVDQNGVNSAYVAARSVAAASCSFEMIVDNTQSTTLAKPSRSSCVFGISGGHVQREIRAGLAADTNAINNALTSLRVLPSTGTFSGVFTLFGLKRG